ncbi:MAG TPA: hypothetical protein PLN52_26405, partial [Opitutaceae bacterium]|nr:hypothetical protein [Opitutaceae bacterium]
TSGKDYLRNRWFEAEVGFISRDWAGYINGDSVYLGYFFDNSVDPTGNVVGDPNPFRGNAITILMDGNELSSEAADYLRSLVTADIGRNNQKLCELHHTYAQVFWGLNDEMNELISNPKNHRFVPRWVHQDITNKFNAWFRSWAKDRGVDVTRDYLGTVRSMDKRLQADFMADFKAFSGSLDLEYADDMLNPNKSLTDDDIHRFSVRMQSTAMSKGLLSELLENLAAITFTTKGRQLNLAGAFSFLNRLKRCPRPSWWARLAASLPIGYVIADSPCKAAMGIANPNLEQQRLLDTIYRLSRRSLAELADRGYRDEHLAGLIIQHVDAYVATLGDRDRERYIAMLELELAAAAAGQR